MGRLVGLELHNFKSYRGTVSVGFGTANFTSIIGPNGSGKSNMMDAISFVLGVQSTHLRSNKLKDLIYRGRVVESNQDDQAEGRGADPVKAYVMAVYEKTNGEILQLKRTITAAGQSTYRINDRDISAKEFSKILKEENILIKARNFLVFQGDVEQIASQSATDLSRLIEMVSGSADLKAEYDALREEQDKVKEQTAAILSKRRTLTGEVKQYKEQSDEAELFREKLAEKNDCLLMLNLWKLYHIDQKKNSLLESIKETKNKFKSLKNEISKEDSHFQEIKAQFAKESLKLTKFQKLIDAKKAEIKTKNQKLVPYETEIEHLHKKISQMTKNSDSLTDDIASQEAKIKQVESNIATIKKSQKKATAEILAQSGDITEEDHEEYLLLKRTFLSQGGAAEVEKLSLLLNRKKEIEHILENLEKQKSATSDRVDDLKAQQAELKTQLTSVSRDLNDINSQVAQKQKYIQQLQLNAQDYDSKQYELQSKMKEVLSSIDEMSANERETKRERKLRENVSILKRAFPGVIGLLVDLVSPSDHQYSVALNVILGKHLDAIVVESSATAHQCIQYLKKQRAGTASFIPLDIIEAKPIDNRYRHLDHRARPTIDIVEYEPRLERAVQFACGDSMVCDSLDVARNIKFTKQVPIKAVCLDGTLISKSNTMTGGYSANQERRWNRGEVTKLNDLLENLKHEMDVLSHNKPDHMYINSQELDLRDLQTRANDLRRQRVELDRALTDVDAEIKYYSENSETAQKKEQYTTILHEIESDIAKQDATVESLQSEIFKSFCQKHNFKSIKEYELSTGSELRQQSMELKHYELEIIKQEKKLKFEQDRRTDTSARLQTVQSTLKKLEQSLKKLLKEKEDLNESIDHSEAELVITQEDMAAFEKSNSEKMSQIRDVEERLNDAIAKQEGLKKEAEIRMEDVEKYNSERLAIFTTCNIENIRIPSKNQDFPIDTTQNVDVDYSGLPSQYKQAGADGSDLEEKISELTKKLEQLTPNVKAIERLQEVKEKLDQIEDELGSHRQHEMKVVNKFQKVKDQRYDLFMNAFTHISEKIDTIYKELTKKEQTTQLLGGSAYLTLEDEDEPYLAGIRYHAMPPNKRFKDMDLLSGGEKTIAALALLFAIHSFHPSPFFVLDEVDAALDHNNVNQIARYIMRNSGPDFQFIVISLKNALFEKSDALVGIYREQKENSSRTLTLDLRSYPEVA